MVRTILPFAILLIAAHIARAQEPTPPSSPPPSPAPRALELGARVGYAVADGSLLRGYAVSDRVPALVPFQLDVAYRVNPALSLGAFGSFGYGITAGCDQSTCTAQDYRFGLGGQLRLAPTSALDPWVGLSIGYELLRTTTLSHRFAWGSPTSIVNPYRPGPMPDVVTGASTLGFDASTLQRGPVVTIDAGLDWVVAPRIVVGPFVAASIGELTHNWHAIDGVEIGADIDDRTLHEWFTVGVRGRFDALAITGAER